MEEYPGRFSIVTLLLTSISSFSSAKEPPTPPNSLACAALRQNLLHVREELKSEKIPADVLGSTDVLKPRPFGTFTERFVLTAGRFLTTCPNEKDTVDIAYELGKLLYDYSHFEAALAEFDRVVSQHPEGPLAEFAANLSLDILNLRKDYQGIEKLARRYAADRVLMRHKTLKESLKTIIPQTLFKLATDWQQKAARPEELELAAQAFSNLADEFPKSSVADSALFNAAVILKKAGKPQQARTACLRLSKQYPKSALASRCLNDPKGELPGGR